MSNRLFNIYTEHLLIFCYIFTNDVPRLKTTYCDSKQLKIAIIKFLLVYKTQSKIENSQDNRTYLFGDITYISRGTKRIGGGSSICIETLATLSSCICILMVNKLQTKMYVVVIFTQSRFIMLVWYRK